MPTESSQHGHARNDEKLAELRALLVGPEQAQIDSLRQRLDDPSQRAQELAASLPDAIRLRAGRDNKLRAALQPVLEEAMQTSIRKDKSVIADALYPVIGMAVRKAIARALQGMMESLNQALEQRFSLRSLRWRLEAYRTGKSYGEILLLHSLSYRVEQVFLIHRTTGLLLQHAVAENAVVKDADLVSGMLTAIQDFVSDSFDSAESEQLERMQVGEHSVWVQYGPQAILAGVVRGTAPAELQGVFHEALETVHGRQGNELAAFKGDATPFASSLPLLKACLLGRSPATPSKRFKLGWAAAAVVLAAIGVWAVLSFRDHRRWADYIERLNSEPGIVVTDSRKEIGHYIVAGLRDPLSRDPGFLLQEVGIPPDRVTFRWKPYLSLDSQFAQVRKLESQKNLVEGRRLHFATGSAQLTLAQMDSLAAMAGELRSLLASASQAGRQVRIEVHGRTDQPGPEGLNAKLAQERAERVKSALVEQGLPARLLAAVGDTGTGDRNVSFHVILGQE